MIAIAQIFILQIICTAGLVTALLLLRFRALVLKAVSATEMDSDLVDGARQNRFIAFMQSVSWLGFFTVVILAEVTMPSRQPTADIPLGGQIIGWLLIGSIGMWAFITVNVYAYALRKWWESPTSSLVAPKDEVHPIDLVKE